MILGILKEPSGENRVSLLPETAADLMKAGWTVCVEAGAGEAASAFSPHYESVGVQVLSREEIWQKCDWILSIQLPEEVLVRSAQEVRGKRLTGVYQPLWKTEKVQAALGNGYELLSLDLLPRITRAQPMDVLSSQANIAGYKAVIEAAHLYPRYFPMLMTAAGSVPPARLLILGAGVAGLQAIATARRLGAVVEVFDTRPEVKEQVLSLGAKFVEVEGAADASKAGGYAVEQSASYQQKQQERIEEALSKSDIVITTAQIPGRKAPLLITENMLNHLRPGSVVIDLAASSGGNVAFTKDRETVWHNGIQIVGASHLPSTMPSDASKMYGRNLYHFLKLFDPQNETLVEDELVLAVLVKPT